MGEVSYAALRPSSEMSLSEFLHHSMEWIAHSGGVGVGWFIFLYTLTCVFFLPGSILTIGAGAVYGFWFSTALVTVSSTVGAAANFLTSRYLARNWMQRKIGHNAKFRALEKAVCSEGWRMILDQSHVANHSSQPSQLCGGTYSDFILEVHPGIVCWFSSTERGLHVCGRNGRQGIAYQRRSHPS